MSTEKYVAYIVNYNNPDRSEGGAQVTRHFGSLKEAAGFIDLDRKSNPNNSGHRIVKQTSVITRELIAWEQQLGA